MSIFLCLEDQKIIVNFSESVDFDQLKGRVFEAINCGAVLLDSINSPISKYFEDKKHFVSYKDEIDLPLQIQLLLSDPNKYRRISKEVNKFF